MCIQCDHVIEIKDEGPNEYDRTYHIQKYDELTRTKVFHEFNGLNIISVDWTIDATVIKHCPFCGRLLDGD